MDKLNFTDLGAPTRENLVSQMLEQIYCGVETSPSPYIPAKTDRPVLQGC